MGRKFNPAPRKMMEWNDAKSENLMPADTKFKKDMEAEFIELQKDWRHEQSIECQEGLQEELEEVKGVGLPIC